jgi:hypothetical protein
MFQQENNPPIKDQELTLALNDDPLLPDSSIASQPCTSGGMLPVTPSPSNSIHHDQASGDQDISLSLQEWQRTNVESSADINSLGLSKSDQSDSPGSSRLNQGYMNCHESVTTPEDQSSIYSEETVSAIAMSTILSLVEAERLTVKLGISRFVNEIYLKTQRLMFQAQDRFYRYALSLALVGCRREQAIKTLDFQLFNLQET